MYAMGRYELAQKILRDADERLRAMLIEAATDGDYDNASRISVLAKAIGLALGGPVSSVSAKDVVREDRIVATASSGRGGTSKKQKARSEPERGEPVFLRENQDIVKIGKSRSGADRYEHRAPLVVALRLSEKLAAIRSSEKLVKMEDVLPLLSESGVPWPSYQSYVVLGWLKKEGLVRQHGKRGYTVSNPMSIVTNTRERFEELELA